MKQAINIAEKQLLLLSDLKKQLTEYQTLHESTRKLLGLKGLESELKQVEQSHKQVHDFLESQREPVTIKTKLPYQVLPDIPYFDGTLHYIHGTEKDELNGMINAFTEGLFNRHHHLELQIVIPMKTKQLINFLMLMSVRIAKGIVYESDTRYTLTDKHEVYIKTFKLGKKDVLRVIFPDDEGRFPFDEGCTSLFARQMDPLPTH